MCSRSMRAFKQAILQNSTVVEIFSTTPPVSLSGSEVTIDASKFIHCPPEPSYLLMVNMSPMMGHSYLPDNSNSNPNQQQWLHQ